MFELGEIVESIVSLFRGRIITSKVTVETSLPAGIVVSAPQGQVRQVIANLIVNGLELEQEI